MTALINRSVFSLYGLMVVSLGFGTVSLVNMGSVHLRIWEILLGGIICLAVIKMLIQGKVTIQGEKPFVLGYCLFLSVFLSGLKAYDTAIWVKQTILLCAMFLLFEVVAQRCSAKQLSENMRLVIYPGVLIAAWGILEAVFSPHGLQMYHIGGAVIPRARSFFVEANEFSQYLALPFAFIMSTLLLNKTIPKWERWFYYCGLVAVVMAQVMSLSRGGFVAFAGELLALFFLLIISGANMLKSILRINLCIFLMVILFGILYVTQPRVAEIFQTMFERGASLFSGHDATAGIRFDGINIALDKSTENLSNFLIGIGFGNLPVILGAGVATTANLFVDVLTELGLFGLIVFCGIVFAVVTLPLRVLRILIESKDQQLLSVFFGAYLSFAGLVAGGLTYATHMLNLFWFSGGLLVALYHHGTMLQRQRRIVDLGQDDY